MDTQLAREPHRSGLGRLAPEPLGIAEIGHHLVDHRHPGQPPRQDQARPSVEDLDVRLGPHPAHVHHEVLRTEVGTDDARRGERRSSVLDTRSGLDTGDDPDVLPGLTQRPMDGLGLGCGLEHRHEHHRQPRRQGGHVLDERIGPRGVAANRNPHRRVPRQLRNRVGGHRTRLRPSPQSARHPPSR